MTKEEILAEIRRTAEENDGKPLGAARFRNATNIGPYHWGEHWANWGEAVKDAGFMPNKKLIRVDDEVLVEQMIILIRKLGKYPTFGEMRVYKRQKPDFRFIVIKNRQQQYMLKAIMEYCEDKPEYTDITKICEPLYKAPTAEINDSEERTHHGFVYMIKGHPSEYKIGSTGSINRRIPELDATSSVRYELIKEIETDDRYGVETYWHKRFKDKHIRREWFRLKPADIKAFKRWRNIF